MSNISALSTQIVQIFQKKVLQWFVQYGRHDLPWQKNPTPYRVWVSEIMLQQTQVSTVIPYYQAFMQSFPNLTALATANIDEVMRHWAGLGYYSRARNLHRSAQIIAKEYKGRFPTTRDGCMSLPGIGQSTAGAILSLSKGKSYAILDGNVKRVLSRFFAVKGWAGVPKVQQKLWSLAEHLTPVQHVKDYNQAMMDLGATLCTRTQPQCGKCPLQQNCTAYQSNCIKDFPTPKPRLQQPLKKGYFLVLIHREHKVLITKRPNHGIWGGLWCLPWFEKLTDLQQWTLNHIGVKATTKKTALRHVFSHFKLDLIPVVVDVEDCIHIDGYRWIELSKQKQVGMPAPIHRLLQQLKLAVVN